jgi:hypothetical protein
MHRIELRVSVGNGKQAKKIKVFIKGLTPSAHAFNDNLLRFEVAQIFELEN